MKELNDICTADEPSAELRLTYPPLYPVYLMKDDDGILSTFTARAVDGDSAARSIESRRVSLDDAELLCSRGVNVKFLEVTEVAAPSVPEMGVTKKVATRVTTLPSNFSIVILNGQGNGGFYLNTFKVAFGGTTLWTTYDFQSSGITTSGVGQHAFTILFFDDVAGYGSSTLDGNGIIMGYVNSSPSGNGCGDINFPGLPFYNSEVEAWWPEANFLVGESCLNVGMTDNSSYHYDIQADIYNNIAYSRNGQAATVVNVGVARGTNTLNPHNWSLLFGTSQGRAGS